MKNDFFSTLHPIIPFTYFTSVIAFSMFFLHPIFLLISLLTSFLYSIYLNAKKAVKFNFLFLLPMFLFFSIINPFINHMGVTILVYVNDQPITLEAFLYGIAAGIMFISVLAWFSCSNVVMTSDKFLHLFGKLIPSLSLVFTMTLRFVPKYKAQIKLIANAQKGIGKGIDNGNLLVRIKNGLRILSILTTWALENGIDTADSMYARGFGNQKRSTFSIYPFNSRDKIIFLIELFLIFTVFAGSILGENTISYFPVILIKSVTTMSILVYSSYALLCLYPIILNIWYRIQYQYSKV